MARPFVAVEKPLSNRAILCRFNTSPPRYFARDTSRSCLWLGSRAILFLGATHLLRRPRVRAEHLVNHLSNNFRGLVR